MNTTVSSINEKTDGEIRRHDVMAGLSANGIASFVSRGFSTNDTDLDSSGHPKSVDERAFSDFGIDGSEKDWKQDARSHASNSYNTQSEEREKKETADMVRDQAMDEMREEREERMKKMMDIGGFSPEVVQDVAKDELSEFEKTARENGWDEEKSSTIEASLIILADPNSTSDQREEAWNSIEVADPDYANELFEKMHTKQIELESSIDHHTKVADTLKNDGASVTEVTRNNASAVYQAIEAGTLSNEEITIAKATTQNELEVVQDDFDMLFEEDNSVGSYSENVTPENKTQSIASNFTNATNAIDSSTVESSQDFEKTKTFDVGNTLT